MSKISLEEEKYVIDPYKIKKEVARFKKLSLQKAVIQYYILESRIIPKLSASEKIIKKELLTLIGEKYINQLKQL